MMKSLISIKVLVSPSRMSARIASVNVIPGNLACSCVANSLSPY
jgi:hypothetical protein